MAPGECKMLLRLGRPYVHRIDQSVRSERDLSRIVLDERKEGETARELKYGYGGLYRRRRNERNDA